MCPLVALVSKPVLTMCGMCDHRISGPIESMALGGRNKDWQLIAFHTCPEHEDANPSDRIQLGEGAQHMACLATKVDVF